MIKGKLKTLFVPLFDPYTHKPFPAFYLHFPENLKFVDSFAQHTGESTGIFLVFSYSGELSKQMGQTRKFIWIKDDEEFQIPYYPSYPKTYLGTVFSVKNYQFHLVEVENSTKG